VKKVYTFALRKRRKEKAARLDRNPEKAVQKNKKYFIWKTKKGSYLCTPETNEGNFEKKREKRLAATANGIEKKVRRKSGKLRVAKPETESKEFEI